jgi:hypothetical protein
VLALSSPLSLEKSITGIAIEEEKKSNKVYEKERERVQ